MVQMRARGPRNSWPEDRPSAFTNETLRASIAPTLFRRPLNSWKCTSNLPSGCSHFPQAEVIAYTFFARNYLFMRQSLSELDQNMALGLGLLAGRQAGLKPFNKWRESLLFHSCSTMMQRFLLDFQQDRNATNQTSNLFNTSEIFHILFRKSPDNWF